MHFFFAWLLVATLLVWLCASLIGDHIRRDLAPTREDLVNLPRDFADHARFRFHHRRSPQRAAKAFPWRRPVCSAAVDGADGDHHESRNGRGGLWLLELFGGRQTARTIHFW